MDNFINQIKRFAGGEINYSQIKNEMDEADKLLKSLDNDKRKDELKHIGDIVKELGEIQLEGYSTFIMDLSMMIYNHTMQMKV